MKLKKQTKSKTVPLKVIDLFAGVGGFRIGLEWYANYKINHPKFKGDITKIKVSQFRKQKRKPFKVVWGSQWEPGIKTQHAAEIYKREFQTTTKEFSNEDIGTVKVDNIPNHDVLVGGFPCQDYSVATTLKHSGGIQGKKGVLWWEIERILREKGKNKPKYLILENVDRLLSSPSTQRGRDFAIMMTCLNELGYAVEWRVINASEYGLPQRRKRVFFLGYHKSSPIYEKISQSTKEEWIQDEGVLAQAFPIKSDSEHSFEITQFSNYIKGLKKYTDKLHAISSKFNKGGNKSPFSKAGVLFDGKVFTMDVAPDFTGESTVLKDVLISDKQVEDEFYISKDEYEKWEYLKGAKKIDRVSKSTGFKYKFSEGAITYPDNLKKPSRTIITGEGGKAPSRFKHVIKTSSGKLRRLTPIELERLGMFPDNHTASDKKGDKIQISNSRRAFLMGNALVVGVVEKIGIALYESINK